MRSRFLHEVQANREQIKALQAERDSLLGDPSPSGTGYGRRRNRDEVKAELERMAERLFRKGAEQARRTLIDIAFDRRTDLLSEDSTDMAASLAYLFGPGALVSPLLLQLDAVPDGPNAADRKARLEAIEQELDELELAEERLIEMAEEEGEPIARRPDIRAEIVLAPRIDD
jgi:hypothetical protein